MSTNFVRNPNITVQRIKIRRGSAFGIILIAALIMFEMFNFSSTEYALSDLLGDLTFLGIRWATILAIAFCGIDFAGIARLNTPEEGSGRTTETWYLFGAWLLAATMNAMLTWWGVSLAFINHQSHGSTVIDIQTLLRVVPVFVAVLVWLIRVLIIGTYATAGARLFSQQELKQASSFHSNRQQQGSTRSLGNAPSNYNSGSRGSYANQRGFTSNDSEYDDPDTLNNSVPSGLQRRSPVSARSENNSPPKTRY